MSTSRFATMMAVGGDVILDEAALLVAAALRPELDEIEWLAALDRLAGDCPTPTAKGVARYLFDTLGFTGNESSYYDWQNSCLDRVIATRVGIPITLSVLMIEVARRVGVPLVGVGMPAHFVVGVADDADAFYDPFHGPDRLDRSAAVALFHRVTGGGATWNDDFLAATSHRDIVIRMLNNLRAVFVRRSDVVRLGIVMTLRAQVPELAAAEHSEIIAATAPFN
jgi:regulator of sirC expression with transglutaminase-like and TPR domain